MGKRITALKCPQCGSVKKQDVKEDHYICHNCGTEYFLDNDDVNIHIRHRHDYPKAHPLKGVTKQTGYLIYGIVGSSLFILILASVFRTRSDSGGTRASGHSRKEYADYVQSMTAYGVPNRDAPVLLFRINRNVYGEGPSRTEYILRFYDPVAEKTLNDQQMPEWNVDFSLKLRRFSDGNFYASPDKLNRIYQLNQTAYRMEDVTDKLLANIPELSSGVATINILDERYGDGFEIMTNEGKMCYYYPLANKMYTKVNRGYNLDQLFEGFAPTDTESVHYVFSRGSSDYPEHREKQLVKYWYKSTPGDATNLPHTNYVQWRKETIFPKKSGVYYGQLPKKKVLFTSPLVTRFVDLTPGRKYYEPDIIYQDSVNLYIKALPNANPEGNQFVQKIDTETGDIRFTYRPSLSRYSLFHEFSGYSGGLTLRYRHFEDDQRINRIVMLNNKGEVIKELDLETLFK